LATGIFFFVAGFAEAGFVFAGLASFDAAGVAGDVLFVFLPINLQVA